MSYTIIRPGSFMQNTLASAASIKAEGVFYGAQGEGKAAMIDTRDVAAAAAAILRKPGPHAGKTFVLTGPEALSQAQVAEKLSKVIGKPVKFVSVPPEAAYQRIIGLGMPWWLAHDLVAMSVMVASGGASVVSDSVRQLIGRSARTFDEFAADFAGVFM